MINGKTMANLRKIINVRLANNEKDFIKYASRLTHVTHKIFDKNYASTHEIRPVLRLNKPNYFLLTVLELSKWLMYDFHYNFIKKHFDAELLFTDKIVLLMNWNQKIIMKNFLSTNICLISVTIQKNLFGKMKDESEGKIIDEFVGLKSKMYSMKNIDGKESNTAKGVNIATEFNEFKDTLFNKKVLRQKMRRIQVKKHKLRTYEVSKISLSCFDDKRFALNNGIHTPAYFDKYLKK